MSCCRRKFVAKPRQWAVMDSLANHIESVQRRIDKLERTGGSERTQDRLRLRIERMRAIRASIIDNDWEALVR